MAIVGTDSCRMHAGKSGELAKAAGRAAVEAAETRKFIDLSADAVTDPVEELAKLAGVVKSFAERLTGRIEELNDLVLTTDTGGDSGRFAPASMATINTTYVPPSAARERTKPALKSVKRRLCSAMSTPASATGCVA